jgi:beta-phosphoglucomutase family hydrolase
MEAMLGLPKGTLACLFDLDGVLTETAAVHAAAWKEMFDDFLAHYRSASASAADLRPFDAHDDYDEYVDGKPRLDGVKDFLASRHIQLPEGSPEDPPAEITLHGLGNKKNETVLRKVREGGVEAYPGSVRYVEAVREAGLRTAVVSSSTNCRDVLSAAGILTLFDGIIDGHIAEREHMAGKPAPDTYLAGSRLLEVTPAAAAVFEDALAGVAAGRAGNFGYVVGVDRAGQADALVEHGADRVVEDLSELLTSRT